MQLFTLPVPNYDFKFVLELQKVMDILLLVPVLLPANTVPLLPVFSSVL